MSGDTVAVWYWRYGALHYSLHPNEEEAAAIAVYTESDGEGAVAGVQFADGRVLAAPEKWTATSKWWPAYKVAEDRVDAGLRQALQAATPLPTRQVRDPFGLGKTLTIEAEEPEWLGAPVTETP